MEPPQSQQEDTPIFHFPHLSLSGARRLCEEPAPAQQEVEKETKEEKATPKKGDAGLIDFVKADKRLFDLPCTVPSGYGGQSQEASAAPATNGESRRSSREDAKWKDWKDSSWHDWQVGQRSAWPRAI